MQHQLWTWPDDESGQGETALTTAEAGSASAAPPDPLPQAAARAVQTYLRLGSPPEVVRDPWSRLCDGLLVRVHVSRWNGEAALTAADFGLDPAAYRAVAARVRWGRLNLLPEEGKWFAALESRFRRLPERWGIAVHWGRFVPVSAWEEFRREWETLEAIWNRRLDDWLAAYDPARRAAATAARDFATAAAAHARRLGQISAEAEGEWVERLVDRILAHYPSADDLRRRFVVRYEAAVIPRPSLELEEIQRIEALQEAQQRRREALQRQAELAALRDHAERLRLEREVDDLTARIRAREAVIREELDRMRAEARARAARLLAEFETTYARQVRERLWESLRHAAAALAGGRMTPMATRSLRATIEELRRIAMADDDEITAMLDRLEHAMGPRGVRRREHGPQPADLERQIGDMALLLQTAILALGGDVRRAGDVPPTLDVTVGDAPLAPEVRGAARRLGLQSSLAEVLVEEAGLTRAALRRRVDGAARAGAGPAPTGSGMIRGET